MQLYGAMALVTALLRQEGRVTYWALQQQFGFDAAFLAGLRDELRFQGLALDEGGTGLVWTGDTPASVPGVSPTPQSTDSRMAVPASYTPLPLPSTVPTALVNGSPAVPVTPAPAAVGATAAAAPPSSPHDPTPAEAQTPVHSASEAERRQLTVMFCDLADSTRLSQQLDAEDLREVVRAYQATAATVIHHYEGHIAQYRGDGLLVYFGWPVAHENDALRGVHAGLSLVDAITTTLNPRLEREKGVQLAVRIGLHTGPVVVGEMGGGGRHEHLPRGTRSTLPRAWKVWRPPTRWSSALGRRAWCGRQLPWTYPFRL